MIDYALMNQCLYEGKAKEVEQMTKAALAEGRPVQEILQEGLIAGMSVVGEDFKYNILYVPEVLIAARAMKAAMAILKPLLTEHDTGVKPAGVVLMGTVRGDLHDIGKNLVCMLAEGAGFQVHDIGVDQSIDKFLAATEKYKPDIIGMSALLTTTMTYMKTVIDGYKERELGHIKMAIGGAPVSEMFADEIGADGYAPDASSAVDLFLRLMGQGETGHVGSQRVEVDTAPAAAPAPTGGGSGVSRYQILFWQDIPSEIKAWNGFDEVKLNMPPRFAERIDALAQEQGCIQADAYSAHFHWSEEAERTGSPAQVAASVQKELEAAAP
jgi:5-methyltetrahydrofolate--homocysteine methyltransferase